MDADRFDDLAKVLAERTSRRWVFKGLAAAALGALGLGESRPAAATCRPVGSLCREGANCCSRVCGPRDRFGRHTCQCPAPTVACGRSCVDTNSDFANCGQCGNVCPSGVCEKGVCTTSSTCTNAPDGTICDDGNPCTIDDTCIAGVCTAGHPLNCDDGNPCTNDVCDPFGRCVHVPLNCDDGNACTDDVCDPVGGCVNIPLPPFTACNQNGGAVCDGQGQCLQCLSAADCPAQDTECQTRTCNAGTCGVSFAPTGMPVSAQTTGDCRKAVCDGAGNIVDEPDNSDLPADDGNQCTLDVCANGLPSHPPAPVGTTCNQNGGTVCDGKGNCVV